MGVVQLPVSTSSGAIYGAPTVFNASGTYTIPPTATANSTIIVEAIGGGSGGRGPVNLYSITNLQDYIGFPTVYGGQPGQTVIGTYRLGFLTTTPAGQSLTVTVGAGGSGATMNGNATINVGAAGSQFAITNAVQANNGGASSVSYSGSTFITASGGTSTATNNLQTSNSFMTAVDSGILSNLGPRGGVPSYYNGNVSVNTMTVVNITNTSPGARDEWGGTVTNSPAPSSSYTWGSGTFNLPGGTDAVAGTGGAGGSGGLRGFSASTNNLTITRAGNGAAPGGGGGGTCTDYIPTAQSTNAHTINSGQKGGNGGAGRVRIYYQA